MLLRIGLLLLLAMGSACGGSRGTTPAPVPVAAPLQADAYAHYLKGQVAAFEGRIPEAIAHLRQAKHAAPDEVPIRLKLVEHLHSVGKYDEALSEIAQAKIRWPRNPLVWSQAATVARSLHRFAAASRNYQEAIALGDDSEEIALAYAAVLVRQEKTEDAQNAYRRALETYPQSSELNYQFAKFLYLSARETKSATMQDSISHLKKVTSDNPFALRAWALLALCHYWEGNASLGDDALRTPFDRSEGKLWVADTLLDALLDMETRTNDPMQSPSGRLSSILDRSDLLPDTRISLAHYHLKLGDFSGAAALADKLKPLSKTSGAVEELKARALLGLRRGNEAEQVLRSVGRESASYPLMRAILATHLADDNRASEARTILNDALTLFPDNAELVFAQARVEELAGDYAKSRELLTAVLDEHPMSKRARYSLAELQLNQNNTSASVALIRALVENNPRDADALNYIAYAQLKMPSKRAQSRLLLLRALELSPDNPYILDSYGWLLYLENDLSLAAGYLERAERLSPAQAETVLHLAELRWKQGQRSAATRLFERALGLADNAGLRDKIQSRRRLLEAKP